MMAGPRTVLPLAASAAALLLGGCAGGPGPPRRLIERGILVPGEARPWSHPYRHEGAFCSVRSNAGPRVASYLGDLLDAEFRALEGLLGSAPTGTVRVRAYATLEGFRRAAGDGPFTRRTRGTFSPRENEIRLALVEDGSYGPASVLLHEGAHAYLHGCFDFAVPPRSADAAGRQRLPSVPWWLREGLATCMEAAAPQDGELELGTVSPGRYRELQRVLRAERAPSLRQLLQQRPGGTLRSVDYAAAWGLCHALLHHPEPKGRARRRRALGKYLAACRRGFFADPDEGFSARFIERRAAAPGFRRQWAKWVSRRSLRLFKECFVSPGQTLEDWEARWREEMLRLPPAADAPLPASRKPGRHL